MKISCRVIKLFSDPGGRSVFGIAGLNPTEDINVFLLLGTFATLRKATISFVMSVCLTFAWNNLALNAWIFIKFDIRNFFEKFPRNVHFH